MKAKDKVSVLLLLLLFTLCTNPDAMTQHTKKIGVDRIWQICLVAARDAYLSLRDTIQGDPFNKIFSSFTFCRVSYLNCQTRSKLYFAVDSLWQSSMNISNTTQKHSSNYLTLLKLYNATIVRCIVYNYTCFVTNVSKFTQNRGSYLLTTHVLIENTAKHQSVIRLRGVSCPLPVSLAAKQLIFADMVFFSFRRPSHRMWNAR